MRRIPLPIIVGMDPGTTTALAVLDTEGNLLFLKSRKNMTRADISRTLGSLGRPVMVAGDRNPPPSAVERLASVFSARLVVPEESLTKKDKNALARRILEESRKANQHEKDALASAVYALNSIRPAMRRVSQKVEPLGLPEGSDLENYVRARVILNRDNVRRALERFMKG